MKSLIRYLLLKIYNMINSNDISVQSLCSHKVSRNSKSITIKGNSLVDRHTMLGAHSYIGYGVFISSASIGRYCSIGNYVSIGPGEHSLKLGSTHAYFSNQNGESLTKDPVALGPDVWVGGGAIILRGVNVGCGAVIGAGAVVTKDVPPYAIVVGVPAKIIRYRFSQNKIEKFLQSSWWNADPVHASKILKSLEKIE